MNLKRIELKALSILMALAMIIGMCPSLGLSVHAEGSSGTVLAASGGEQGNLGEGKTVLAFTSDIHNTSNNTAANRLDTWLDNEMSVYGHIDGMCFCGDMGGAQANESEFWSFTQSVMSVVEDNAIPGVYTTGNHEFYNGKYSTTSNTTVKDRYIVGAEGLNGSNYRIYCLGTDNWNNSSDNYTTSQVDTLNSYLESAGTDKPIIILTHFPLHRAGSSGSSGWGGYTRQTTNADLVIDALNAGAARGQTIVLLWGHNHTLSDAFYDQIYYPGYNLQYSSSGSKTIQFYYGAAGCMSDSEYGTGSAYVKGKGLIITIDEDDNDLDFHYYNASGTDVTEDSEGNPGGGDDPGSDAPSSTTYQFNEVSELTAGKDYVVAVADASGEKVIAIRNNGSNNDVTGVSLDLTSGQPSSVTTGTSSIIWTCSGTEGSWELKNDGLNFFPTSSMGVMTYERDRILTYDNGVFHFDSTSTDEPQTYYVTYSSGTFGTSLNAEEAAIFLLFEKDENSGTVDPVSSYRYEKVDAFEAGEEYVIAAVKDDSSVYAMKAGSSSVSAETLTLKADGETLYVDTTESKLLWTYTSSSYLQNGSNYFYPTSSNGIMVYSSGRAINYADGAMYFSSSSSGDFYITCDDGSFSTSKTAEDAATIYIFKKTATSGGGSDQPDDPDDPDPPVTSYRYEKADAFEAGEEYVFGAVKDETGLYAVKAGSSSASAQELEVKSDGEILYVDTTDTSLLWTYTSKDYLQNGSNYFYPTSSNGIMVYSSGRAMDYADGVLSFSSSSSGTYYLTCEDGTFGTSKNAEDAATFYIFKKTATSGGGSDQPDDPDDPDPSDAPAYKLASALEDGGQYLIINSGDTGSVRALTNPGGSSSGASMGKTSVDAVSGDIDGDGIADQYIQTDETAVVWTASAIDGGFKLTNGTDYLEGASGEVKVYSSKKNDYYWLYTEGQQLQNLGGRNTSIVYYSNGAFTSTYQESDDKVYIYELVEQAAPHTHVYDAPVWTWTEDEAAGYTAEAAFTCSGCDETVTVQAVVTSAVTKEATETEEGELLYTAVAEFDGASYTDTKSVVIPKLEHVHVYGDAVWTWTEDEAAGYTAEAIFTCSGCDETITVQAVVTSAVTKEVTETEDGEILYTATAEFEGASYTDTKTETIPKLAHTHAYEGPVWNWAEDFTTVEAVYTCTVCGETIRIQAEVTSRVTAEPTCTEEGSILYIAFVSGEDSPLGVAVSDIATGSIPAIGHDWDYDNIAWTWTEIESGGYTAEASVTCKNDPAHTNSASAVITAEVTKEATETGEGEMLYTAVVVFDGVSYSDTKTVSIPKLDHTHVLGAPVWYWAADHASASAEFTCSSCGSVITVEASVSSLVTSEPTCTEKGSVLYIAFISAEESPDGNDHSDISPGTIPALGHDWDYQDITWTWTAKEGGGYNAAASVSCKRDADHVQTADAVVTSEITSEATADEEGEIVYTAEVVFDGTSYFSTKTDTIPRLILIPELKKVESTTNGIKVSWYAVNGAENYRLFYKVAGGKWTKIIDTADTEYLWTEAVSGTKYTFTVRCVSTDGSTYTSYFDTTGKTITYIAAPVVTKAENTVDGVKITWEGSEGSANYRLFYKVAGGKWTAIVDTTETSYLWTEAESGTRYTFVVRAINSAGTAYTSALNTAGKTITYIAAPAVTKVENTLNGVKVTWDAVTGAENYRLFYKVAGGKWTRITDTTRTNFTWIEAVSGTRYTFVVRAVNSAGTSYTSALNSAGKTITYVAVPHITSAVNTAEGISLTWEGVEGAAQYRIFYRIGYTKWVRVADTTDTTFIWDGAVSGTTYTFSIRTMNEAGTAYTCALDSEGVTITAE